MGKEAPGILNALAYSREGEDQSNVTDVGWHGSQPEGKVTACQHCCDLGTSVLRFLGVCTGLTSRSAAL